MPHAVTPNGITFATDLTALISASASGDEASLEALRQFLLPGVRTLLAHRHVALPFAGGVLDLVLREVRDGMIRSQAELLDRTRRVLKEVSAGAQPDCPAPVQRSLPPQSPRDREMMRLYYVDGESPLAISRRMNVSVDIFQSVKEGFRRALDSC